MASTDTFKVYHETLTAPYRNAVAVTPSDTASLGAVTRAVYVGTSGNLAVVMASAASTTSTVTFTSIPYGTLLPIRVSWVLLTGSSATTGIVALW